MEWVDRASIAVYLYHWSYTRSFWKAKGGLGGTRPPDGEERASDDRAGSR